MTTATTVVPVIRIASLLLLASSLACDVEPSPDDLRIDELAEDAEALDEAPPSLEASDELAAPVDPAAVSPGFDIEIELVGDDVVLTWSQIDDASQYGVYDGYSAYFTPPPYAPVGISDYVGGVWGSVGPHQFVHVGAAATTDTHYYRVAAWNPQGYVRGYSATAVKLAQPLDAGLNLVAQPLLDATVDDTASLYTALGGLGGPLGQVQRWNATTQAYQSWTPWTKPMGFDIDPGDAVRVWLSGPALLVTAGLAPAASGDVVHSLLPGWNLVTAPMDLNPPIPWIPTITASTVASSLGAAVQQLGEHDPLVKGGVVYYQHPAGTGTNFTVENHQPIWVQVNAVTPWD